MKRQTQNQTVIGIDLGDKKHLICVTGKEAEVLKEYELANRRQDLERLAKEYPKARVALEVGTIRCSSIQPHPPLTPPPIPNAK